MSNNNSGLKAGSTSVSRFVYLRNTDGSPKTGVAFGDVTAYYTRSQSDPVNVTVAALGTTHDAFSAGGWIEVDGTNCKGLYRLDWPDAAFASGEDQVALTVQVASSLNFVEAIDLSAGATLDASTDVYHADVICAIDAGDTKDQWRVEFKKNGVAVTPTGTPQIAVNSATANSTAIFAAANLAAVTGTTVWKLDQTGSRIAAGSPVEVVLTAMIDSVSRTIKTVTSRG